MRFQSFHLSHGNSACSQAGTIWRWVLSKFIGILLVILTAFGTAALAQTLPPEVDAALARAKVPRDAVTILVTEVQPRAAPRLSHRTNVPVNPAS